MPSAHPDGLTRGSAVTRPASRVPVDSPTVRSHRIPDATRDPIADLKRIAFLLEAAQEPGYRIRAFRSAATTLAGLSTDELAERAATGGLRELSGIGEVTERTILESLRGEEPVYLRRLESTEGRPLADGAAELRAALRGDCHAHTLASDGGASIREMAESAIELGHEYLAITDHSPRLTVANGLTTDRLLAQLDEIAALNAELSPFRLLTGIEVDINEDGSLDQEPEVLARLDVVVGSVHSALRSDARRDDRAHGDRAGRPEPRHPRPLHRAHEDRDGAAVRNRRSMPTSCSPPPRASTRPSRSTRARSGSTRRSASCAWRWRRAAGSPSTRTPTRPASSSGRETAASAPSCAASRQR